MAGVDRVEAVVWAVIAGGPADCLLRPGDVVTGIGGQPVASAAGLAAQVTAGRVAAAADAGARLFLVPSSEAATARQAASWRPVQVVPADSFDAALRVLGVSPARAG